MASAATRPLEVRMINQTICGDVLSVGAFPDYIDLMENSILSHPASLELR